MTILKILSGLIFGLSIVVFFHELGHYIAARLAGIKVEAFSIGFGPALFSFKRKGTIYKISLLPLGGYCKLKGETAFQEALEKNLNSIPREPQSFFSASPLKRIAVSLAGPMGNIIFAFIIVTLLWTIGFTVYAPPAKIVLESDYPLLKQETYPATEAGMQSGDLIKKINNVNIENFRDILEIIPTSGGKNLKITIERDGEEKELFVKPIKNPNTGTYRIGVYPWIEPVIDYVEKNSSADIAGLMQGDRILAINDTKINNTMELNYYITQNRPSKIKLTLLRNNYKKDITLVPIYYDQEVKLGIGFRLEQYRQYTKNPLEAVKKAFLEIGTILKQNIIGLSTLFSPAAKNTVAGPISISYYMGDMLSQGISGKNKAGLSPFIELLAIISIALGIMNLLPIPIMDGGQILIFFIEWIKRKPLHPKTMYRYQITGAFIALILFIIVLSLDLTTVSNF
ncbi:RIP metalloprotease RseP [Spirochaetia bacterium 38H-sp]|uniref:Zinc metalloprotease n=1 Tax=Rarispira pelagica TaxID=3141764 RepID=A0ABU9UBZ5_9SPIR